jgi:omega-6 fatty acid desaturase (delta-12 desaturase)
MSTKHRLISKTMKFTQEHRLKSWYYFLSTLVLNILAFYGTYAFAFIPGKLVCSILTGLLTARLFVIYHDFNHEAILRLSKVARFLITSSGITTLAPPGIWKESQRIEASKKPRSIHLKYVNAFN